MLFSYASYFALLDQAMSNNYVITNYNNYHKYSKCLILRHDIDYSIDKAVEMSERESSKGIKSTYFVLITSDLYNAASIQNRRKLQKIINNGHSIGLHFDETAYPESVGHIDKIKQNIIDEAVLLSDLMGCDITSFSYHRPSKWALDADISVPGMVNSYGMTFFKKFKYISDSRHAWREPVEEIIGSGLYDRIQLLTHAFWYNDKDESMHDEIEKFINGANHDRYVIMQDNITRLDAIIKPSGVILR